MSGASLRRGLVSGALATAALAVADRAERAAVGVAPVYAPGRLARRLAARIGIRLDPAWAEAIGTATRWIYGPLLGVANEIVPREAESVLRRGLFLGGAIWCAELVTLPLIGAAPRLRDWPRGQVMTLAIHTAVFGLAAATTQKWVQISRMR